MRKSTRFASSIVFLFLLLFSLNFLKAELYIKTQSHTDGFEMMGQKSPAKDDTSEQWIGDNRMLHSRLDQSSLIDLEKNRVYIIYHKTKTYVETTLPLNMKKLMPQEMLAMLSMWKIQAEVTPTAETKKIGEWNCKGYKIDITMGMMSMEMKTWATEDVPFDWKSFTSKMYPTLLQASIGQHMDEATLNQYKKIEGFQVATSVTIKIMNQEIKSSSKVVEISTKPAPPGIFAIPAGYKKQDTLIMQKWGM